VPAKTYHEEDGKSHHSCGSYEQYGGSYGVASGQRQGGSSIHIHQYSSWWIEVEAESAEFSLIDGMLIHEAQWLMDMELS